MLNRDGQKVSDLGGIAVYEKYGIKMPLRAKYLPRPNRINFGAAPTHGETLSFFCNAEKPSSCAMGLAYYWGDGGYSYLVNVDELEPIE